MSDPIDFPEEAHNELTTLAAPWGREVTLSAIDHESGLRMMRIRIKEGRRRFTIIDIDEATARAWGTVMLDWAKGGEG